MAGEQDMDSMYAYYDAKLKKYATGGFDGGDEDYVEKTAKNILDATILDKETGLPWAYTVTNHGDDEGEETAWAIGETADLEHWDGSGNMISEAEYITSIFYLSDKQEDMLGKFFIMGDKYFILSRLRKLSQLNSVTADLESEYDESLLPVISGACGKYAIYAMQTNKVIVITMADKEKHDVSYAKKAMGELVKHLMEKEAEYGDQHPYDADPVDGDDF